MTDEQNPKDASQNDRPIENEPTSAEPGETSEEAAGPSPQPDETPQPPTQEAAAPAKKRSPVERAIVWGVIVVLAIVAVIEWRARRSFSQAVEGIRAALRASDESLDDVTLEEAEAMIHGAKLEPAPKQGPYDVRLYRWKGLLRTYTLRLQVAQDEVPIVLAMDTLSDPTAPIGPAYDPYYRPERVVGVDEVPPEEMGAEGDIEEAEAGGPGGGGRRRRSFEDLDANGDGKLTPDELPERMRQFFERMDANKDGGIDKAEFEAARQRRRAQRGREEEEPGEKAEPGEEVGGPAMKSPPPEADKAAKPAAKAQKPKPAQPAPKPKAAQPKPQPKAGQPAAKPQAKPEPPKDLLAEKKLLRKRNQRPKPIRRNSPRKSQARSRKNNLTRIARRSQERVSGRRQPPVLLGSRIEPAAR
ncbi:MAG: EF-hand domain-containing protein [Planctomycetes bacterium]|nr:EF-hand domain-containing protein [Planctomycetota bacterium]